MPLRDEQSPSDLAIMSREGEDVDRALIALAAPESLTDDLAVYLLEAADIDEPRTLVRGLRFCDFIAERNNEWRIVPRARNYLLSRLVENADLARDMHQRLLNLSRSPEFRSEFSELPTYLRETSGRAYHTAALDPRVGLPIYTELSLSSGVTRGQQWLGTQLAREQQDLGILPRSSIEVDFLQGMTLYREGKITQAERLLQSVANKKGVRIEIAVALHLVGRLTARRRRARPAETMLRRSLDILDQLDNVFGQAQVLHSLGQLIGRNRERITEAEEVLRQSLDIGERINNQRHQAQVLHSLGQLIGRNRERVTEAEEMLRQSLDIKGQLGDMFGQAQVLHSLGQLIGRNRERVTEAEEMLRQSLDIEGQLDNVFGQAQVLHSLGQLIGRNRGRVTEAEEVLRQSLDIGERINNQRHQAQVLYSLGALHASTSPEQAVDFFRRSLELNREIGDNFHIRRLEREIGNLLENS